ALWRARHEPGRMAPFPAPDQLAKSLTPQERATIEHLRERVIFGAPDAVALRLAALAATLGVDELVITTTTHDPADRQRSFGLIAEAMELGRDGRGGRTFHGARRLTAA